MGRELRLCDGPCKQPEVNHQQTWSTACQPGLFCARVPAPALACYAASTVSLVQEVPKRHPALGVLVLHGSQAGAGLRRVDAWRCPNPGRGRSGPGQQACAGNPAQGATHLHQVALRQRLLALLPCLPRMPHQGVKLDRLALLVLQAPTGLRVPWAARAAARHQTDLGGAATEARRPRPPQKHTHTHHHRHHHQSPNHPWYP